MKNIYVEGIQGMGKSTLVSALSQRIPELTALREGDYSPVELAWCTYMDGKAYEEICKKYEAIKEEIEKNTYREGDKYIVTYTRILTDIPEFHKTLENYEIYNGRKSAAELEEIIAARYEVFRGEGFLFECSFMQNLVEDLILYQQFSDDEIVALYYRLYEKVDKSKFLLLYLYDEDIATQIEKIRKERCDGTGQEMWYPLMLEYLKQSPYGKAIGFDGFDDMIAHFKHRQEVELRIIEEVIKENAWILPAKKYDLEEIVKRIYEE